LDNCVFEKNATPYVDLTGCNSVRIAHCWVQGRDLPTTPYVRLTGTYRGVAIDGCSFRQLALGNATADNNLRAIQIGGSGESVTISNPEFVLTAGRLWETNPSYTQHPTIEIAPGIGAVSGAGVTIIGGVVHDLDGDTTPRITDASPKTSMIGTAGRIRIPQMAGGELDLWPNKKAGDLAFNTTSQKAVMYDGTQWRDLWS
jgi:hypothetical protein